MRWWNRRESLDERLPGGELLIRECEAFLQGHLAQHVLGGWEEVPVWVWLNCFAHGSRRDIAALGSGGRAWALSYLAEEILAVAEDDDALGNLQVSELIPMELRMLDSGEGARPGASAALVSGVIGAICSYRQSTQR